MAFNNYSINVTSSTATIISGTFAVDPTTNLIKQFFVNGVNVIAPLMHSVQTLIYANINIATVPFVINYSNAPVVGPGLANLNGSQIFYPTQVPAYFSNIGVLITDVTNTAIEQDAGVPNAVFKLSYNTGTAAYQLTYYSAATSTAVTIPNLSVAITALNPICFKEGSEILCLINDIETYIPIETIRKGTLVKTLKNGFIPVDMIGKSQIINPGHDLRTADRLYLCSTKVYPELLEDLYITGAHSILVNRLTINQKANIIKTFGELFFTEDKYRLMACIDDRTQIVKGECCSTIWHLALESDSYFNNFGIFANGLLVESCSRRQLSELSGMEII
jgi:hypothetical protein